MGSLVSSEGVDLLCRVVDGKYVLMISWLPPSPSTLLLLTYLRCVCFFSGSLTLFSLVVISSELFLLSCVVLHSCYCCWCINSGVMLVPVLCGQTSHRYATVEDLKFCSSPDSMHNMTMLKH